jgi:peptide-methionine (S)-S-oxide reductase
MTNPSLEHITLGAGCFWCSEAVYEQVRGVVAVESGYANGRFENPSYEQVGTGTTGHNEVVRVSFDPAQVSLREVLEIFFVIHDPTSLNRQGADAGTQYRSGIYWTSPAQAEVAREVMDEVARSGACDRPVVTELVALGNYSRAEDYHQHYFAQHPERSYCAHVVAPKVQKFRKTFARLARSDG